MGFYNPEGFVPAQLIKQAQQVEPIREGREADWLWGFKILLQKQFPAYSIQFQNSPPRRSQANV